MIFSKIIYLAISYYYYKLVFYNITKNRYSYKFIRGYIVKIVRQIHFVHSTECHSLIQKNDLILLDKNFFVHYILQYTPSSGVHFGIDVYLNRWDLLILLCIQRRMLTKKIGQSIFSFFYLLQYFCMFAWKMLCSMIKDMSVTSTHHLSRFLFTLYTKIVKRPFKIHFE